MSELLFQTDSIDCCIVGMTLLHSNLNYSADDTIKSPNMIVTPLFLFICMGFCISGVNTQTTAFNCNQYILSNEGKEGTIRSQNYPSPYPSSTKCTYIFNGTAVERIQIKFRRVDLFYDGGNPEDPYECDGQDSIKIYIKIDGVEKELAVTCGQKIPEMYMSNIPWMKVVFESGSRTHSNSGFEMEYRFLRNYGIETGEQDDRKVCKFYYKSSVKMSGYFVSPNYPGFYPKNTECQYTFYGRNHEVVKIRFHRFDVDGIPPRCEPKNKVDYVQFSNFDGAPDMKMGKFCGSMTDKMATPLISDLAFFRVTFKSNSIFEGQGFNATYQFIVNEDTTKKPGQEPLTHGNTDSIHTSASLIYYILTILTIKITTSLYL